MTTVSKKIRYFFEAVLAWCFFYIFKALPVDAASAIGGGIARLLGSKLKVSRIAEKNLSARMPEITAAERRNIIKDMWENLGRIVGEFPHMESLTGHKFKKRVGITGAENLAGLKKQNKGGIIFSGHFGNWEFAPKTCYEYGMPLLLVYRPANNLLVDKLIRRSRSKSHNGMYAKGKKSAKQIVKLLKERGFVGMLIDQKMNDGIAVPFFGADAMTAPAIADLALKYECPIVPFRVIRKKGAYFKIEILPPLEIEGKDTKTIMTEINAIFEGWIREHPAQWLWMHKRWPDS